jgi:hypothetical protein
MKIKLKITKYKLRRRELKEKNIYPGLALLYEFVEMVDGHPQ